MKLKKYMFFVPEVTQQLSLRGKGKLAFSGELSSGCTGVHKTLELVGLCFLREPGR